MTDTVDPKDETWFPEEATRTDFPPPSDKQEAEEWHMRINGDDDITLYSDSTASTPKDFDEAMIFLQRIQVSGTRSAINLQLHIQEAPQTEALIEFISELSQLQKGLNINLSGHESLPEVTRLIEQVIKSKGTVKTLTEPPPGNPAVGEELVELELETFSSAKKSSLPALRLERFSAYDHDPDLTKQGKLNDVHVLSAKDFDGSLYETDEHGIILLDFMRFVNAHNQWGFRQGHGNRDALYEGIEYCENWADQRKMLSQGREVRSPFDYQEAIIRSDNLSAAGFEGMQIEELREYADGFVAELKGRIFEYTQPILQISRDYGALPVLITGAPHVLVRPLLKKIGMTHGNGLLYELKNGKLTGRVERYTDEITGNKIEYHMGTSRGKNRLSQQLGLKGYGLVMGFGDSTGDFGLFASSIRRMRGRKWDWDGAAVLVNGTQDVEKRVADSYSTDTDQGRFQVLRPGTHPRLVASAFETAIYSVFEPSMENLENIKRIRDIWTKLGYPDKEKEEIMLKHFPAFIVDAAMKEHTINTKNENDLARHLERIGTSREGIQEILRLNRSYYRRRGATLVPLRKRSSFPPPPESDSGNDSEES